MFSLITLGIASVVTVVGHVKSRKFVGRRLRFTSIVEKPGISVAAGVVAAVAAAPVVAILPLVGVGTAMLFGAGVGTGVALGAKDAKDPLPDEDL